jgi:hypothetical protein
MDKNTFDAADPIIDDIADATTVLFNDASAKELRNLLTKLQEAVGSQFLLNLTLNVDIFDEEDGRCLPLLQTGLSGFGIGEPFQTWNDSSSQRYIADGEMLVVPHDRCPKCWEEWDFKFEHPTCPNCKATLGEDVKVCSIRTFVLCARKERYRRRTRLAPNAAFTLIRKR